MADPSSTETPSPAKKFRCCHAFFIDDIGAKFERRKGCFPSRFTVVRIRIRTGDVQMTMIKIIYHDHEWKMLGSMLDRERSLKGRYKSCGWQKSMSRDQLRPTESFGLHVVFEVEYEAAAVVASAPPRNDRLTDDLLRYLYEEEDADVNIH